MSRILEPLAEIVLVSWRDIRRSPPCAAGEEEAVWALERYLLEQGYLEGRLELVDGLEEWLFQGTISTKGSAYLNARGL